MATKNYMTLANLTTYDGLIKEYIGEEDAKSIKYISVDGNTVSFYKSETGSGTADYEITLPDVSNFMELIEDAGGDKVVVSNADGSVSESAIDVDSLVTGYHLDSSATNQLLMWDDAHGVTTSEIAYDDVITKITDPTAGSIIVSDNSGDLVESGTTINDLMPIGNNWDGNKIVMTNSDGTISEIDVPVTADGEGFGLVTGYFGLPTGQHIVEGYVDESTGRYSIVDTDHTVNEIVSSIDNKISKLDSALGNLLVATDSNGNIYETDYYPSNIDDAQSAADAAQSDVDALETYVGTIPQGATATTVVGYVDEAVADAASDADISLVEAQTPTTGYLKTYELYQGGNAAANLVGKIDIPKDLVVTSGEIVVNPTGQPAGTYLKLTIANQTEPVFINVADLCDVYTAAQSAAQVQLAISSTNEISATIVAGSVTATELASNAVTTAKIADDAVTADKVAISAHTEAQTAGADGVAVSVTTIDGQVSAVSASIAANTYDTYGSASAAQTAAEDYTDSAIAGLDATASQTAGTDGLALSITEVDGKVTAISGSIAANTYDASGAAATAKSEVIGTSSDAASANTVYGAKAYADAATDAIATADIQALFA